jgi:Fe-S-cluster containining protein
MDAVSCNGLPARPLEPEQYTRLTALTRLLLDVLSSDAPTRGADVAIASHALFDRSLAANPLPRKPDCKKGCGHCCRTYVSATAPEIFAIARAMRELPAAHFAAMRERVREAAEATTPGWSQDRFFTYQCPLLEEGACSLHPVRPDACRGVSSYSVDACIRSIAAASQKRDEPIPKVREHAILRSLHAHGLWAALQAAGLPYTYYSLNQGLDRVLDTPEAEPRWLAGEDIFAGVPNDTMLEGQARAMVEATIRTLIAGATGKMPARGSGRRSLPPGAVRRYAARSGAAPGRRARLHHADAVSRPDAGPPGATPQCAP